MAEDVVETSLSSAEPSMYRHHPTSDKTQDISHLLASIFKELYTTDVIGKDTVLNLETSRGGDNAYHEKYVGELEEVHSEYNRRIAEADMLERHIIQARARAVAEEERAVNMAIESVGETYHSLKLPPVESTFRWCVDNKMLRENNLVCPKDYVIKQAVLKKAPKGKSGKSVPKYAKATLSFKQHMSDTPVLRGYRELPPLEKTMESLLKALELNVTEVSTPESRKTTKKSGKQSSMLKKSMWRYEMSEADRVLERAELAKLQERHNFLKNPRFLPPYASHGGKSLIIPKKVVQKLVAGRHVFVEESNPSDPIPVFLANPPVVFFTGYNVSQIYETTVELRNMTSASHHVRVIPPATPYFSLGLGKFPGEGGIVAPGLSCHYTVRFAPDALTDFDDYILVETQAAYPLVVPLEARRSPPILSIPRCIDCGYCLVGGVKIIELLCTNEGHSAGKFCIMPKSTWPVANFRCVATIGFVEQPPFGICPAVFELYPGQGIEVEVAFFPASFDNFTQTFAIVCDNCQVKDITLTGAGQLIALQLVSISGEESTPVAGELTDLTAEHFIRFSSANLHSVTERKLVIRNATHVQLPFHWQIMKPNLQPLMPGEPIDPDCIEYNQDTKTAFSISPGQGTLHSHQDHEFILHYCPIELKEYHSVLHLVLQDIPEPPNVKNNNITSSVRQAKVASNAEIDPVVNDIIAMEIEVKGSTEPFQVLLEPYAILIHGEILIGTTIKRYFKMWNNSKSAIFYEWERISDCHILEVQPSSGIIEPHECSEFELNLTGGKNESTTFKLHCQIRHHLEPVTLHIEATFKGPVVSTSVASLDLGLIKLGDATISTLFFQNASQLAAEWRMQESQACLEERNEEDSQFVINPSHGVLPPLGTCSVSVMFKPSQCQSLQTVLELEVKNGEKSHIPVQSEVQIPKVCLLSCQLFFHEIYIGIPAQETVKLFNQKLLPAKYCWGEDEINDLFLQCTVDDMEEPLALGMFAKPKGLCVTYSTSVEKDIESSEETWKDPSELLLDFGSNVVMKSTVKRQLILTNHSAIPAAFTVQADYFSGCPPTPPIDTSENSPGRNQPRSSLIKKLNMITVSATKLEEKAWRDLAAALLSHGKGAAFLIHPSSGILKPFHQEIIEITAFNNMWGCYHDELICMIEDLKPAIIPMQMTVKGCPLFFQMMGRRKEIQTHDPVVRFGTHISGGDTVSRSLKINNPTPYDIRLDWETYNIEDGDLQLLDLLVSYGEPFPLKDADGNEIIGSSVSDYENEDQTSDWNKIPSTPGTFSSCSHENEYLLIEDEEENIENDKQTSMKKIITVNLRPHEGIATDYPYCITPRQTVVPAGSYATIHVSFTPLTLTGEMNKIECVGFALGFMSLDCKVALKIPGKLERSQGFQVEPLRLDLQAFVKPAVLTVEIMNEDEQMAFYSAASDLIPKFSDFQVKVGFHTSLELLLYQNLPSDQLPPGVLLVYCKNGEKRLEFTQQLVIEYSNKATQLVPLSAFLTVPFLELSCEAVDFGTCFVGQTRMKEVSLINKSGSNSYWAAVIAEIENYEDDEVFSVTPSQGVLEAHIVHISLSREILEISFTARENREYETVMMIHGKLGEQPCRLQIRGEGSYDEKCEANNTLM
nr:PREDICTED: deleted in lung and esophageal cancer protein 1 isoform X1 [Latimeria chalumnae]XP_014342850.1 PREDICTED: deleted in lung and esophageal cancer protein 1 isoform X1 [Latimeria chalumnae]|eukprot:XP_014342849.1 PREDICTED: deleted in lung and esophageal cancer protein 1 isoform X1 [Latimeria chalumnae]